MWVRRALLAALFIVTAAGCTSGSNPALDIRNRADEQVTLSITVVKDDADPTDGVVYNGTVRIAPESERSMTIFQGWRTQYEVTIRYGNQSMQFDTRPICETAHTRVTVHDYGQLSYHVAFCEGPDQSGTSTVATA